MRRRCHTAARHQELVLGRTRVEGVARKRPSSRHSTTILDAIDDPHLFQTQFNHDTWAAWRTFLAALFGLPLTEAQRQQFKQCTGREQSPDDGSNEAWLIIGRRGGKSFTLALIAVYLACF